MVESHIIFSDFDNACDRGSALYPRTWPWHLWAHGCGHFFCYNCHVPRSTPSRGVGTSAGRDRELIVSIKTCTAHRKGGIRCRYSVFLKPTAFHSFCALLNSLLTGRGGTASVAYVLVRIVVLCRLYALATLHRTVAARATVLAP